MTEAFVLAMAATVQEHNRVSGNADSIIVFVVQPDEKNSFDQQVSPTHAHLTFGYQLVLLCLVAVFAFCMSLLVCRHACLARFALQLRCMLASIQNCPASWITWHTCNALLGMLACCLLGTAES